MSSGTGGSAPQAASSADGGVASVAPGQPSAAGGCATFDSAFGAIQTLIFERKGCTASACHGEAAVGRLDLRSEHAYENLVDVRAAGSTNARVRPGSATTSYLYEKLRAASEPGSVQIAGSPMPIGAPALTREELEAIKLWIFKGAPKTGSVKDDTTGVELSSLLDACLPPAMPVAIEPLPVPERAEGIQLVMPPYEMKAASEGESCVPFAYDLTEQVPDEFKNKEKNVVYVNSHWSRQDPTSHHMVIWRPFNGWVPNPQTAPGTAQAGATRAPAATPTAVAPSALAEACAQARPTTGPTAPKSSATPTRYSATATPTATSSTRCSVDFRCCSPAYQSSSQARSLRRSASNR
ncbi:MAG TPA: hypothetical protein VFZ61_24555 [Polyangiales bacterium]